MGTAIKHPVPDRVKPSFVIFNIRALWRSGLSASNSGKLATFSGSHDPFLNKTYLQLSQIFLISWLLIRFTGLCLLT